MVKLLLYAGRHGLPGKSDKLRTPVQLVCLGSGLLINRVGWRPAGQMVAETRIGHY